MHLMAWEGGLGAQVHCTIGVGPLRLQHGVCVRQIRGSSRRRWARARRLARLTVAPMHAAAGARTTSGGRAGCSSPSVCTPDPHAAPSRAFLSACFTPCLVTMQSIAEREPYLDVQPQSGPSQRPGVSRLDRRCGMVRATCGFGRGRMSGCGNHQRSRHYSCKCTPVQDKYLPVQERVQRSVVVVCTAGSTSRSIARAQWPIAHRTVRAAGSWLVHVGLAPLARYRVACGKELRCTALW